MRSGTSALVSDAISRNSRASTAVSRCSSYRAASPIDEYCDGIKLVYPESSPKASTVGSDHMPPGKPDVPTLISPMAMGNMASSYLSQHPAAASREQGVLTNSLETMYQQSEPSSFHSVHKETVKTAQGKFPRAIGRVGYGLFPERPTRKVKRKPVARSVNRIEKSHQSTKLPFMKRARIDAKELWEKVKPDRKERVG